MSAHLLLQAAPIKHYEWFGRLTLMPQPAVDYQEVALQAMSFASCLEQLRQSGADTELESESQGKNFPGELAAGSFGRLYMYRTCSQYM